MKNMAATLVGDILLVLHNADPPNDEEWKKYIEQYLEACRLADGDLSRLKIIACTDGGGPNATQRSQIMDAVNAVSSFRSHKEQKTAVVTSSTLARGMITVGNWLGMKMKAFAPEKVDEVCFFLNITGDAIPRLAQAAQRLSLEVAGGMPKSAASLVTMSGSRAVGTKKR